MCDCVSMRPHGLRRPVALVVSVLMLACVCCPCQQMFIGCPSEKFDFRLDELGGVRIVTRFVPTVKSADDSITVRARDNTFSFTSMDLAAVSSSLRHRDV